jgi:predicted acylesterase/phospholipase RssA
VRKYGLILIALWALGGCAELQRQKHDQAFLLQRRDEHAKLYDQQAHQIFNQLLMKLKAEKEEYDAGRRSAAPTLDVLVISGGGDWGAFGAGVLKGWEKVSKADPLAKPMFDIVTGVSTGSLIAPFAFVGDEDSTEKVVRLYRNPQKDWVKQRGLLFFMPNNLSFAEVPGLERELRENITLEMAKKIVEGGKDERMLVVNATNLDTGIPRAFSLVPEAQRALESGDMSRVHNMLLASSGIPGAFPYREIDGEMYVDGAVTSNVAYGGRMGEEDSVPAVWQRMYPGVKMPKLRYWVIFNNQMRTPPVVVRARWFDIIARSIEVSSRSATVTALRHLHMMADVARLKRNEEVEVRIMAIPDDWLPPKPGIFIKETMNNLADIGEQMGADPSKWVSTPPVP